ncbi:MAG: sugar phosphate isomerase/epimerase [Acholeplasmataceae bacterium]|nr:sugar phosphate isomerase/epimerase [Acholeplasmataceae bacterium]
MNKIGIRGHDIGKMSAYELADQIKTYGFDGVQLVFKKALSVTIDFSNMDTVSGAFSQIDIPLLGAYFNPMNPSTNELNGDISYFKNHLKIAKSIRASFVGSETGYIAKGSKMTLDELHSEQSLRVVTNIFKDLVDTAEKYDSYVAIEGAFLHVAHDPFRIKSMVDQINSPRLKVIIDLYNFLHIDNYQDRENIFQQALDLLNDDIVIFHLKDFIVEDHKLKQVGLGQGLMNFESMISKIKQTNPDAYLIFEGVTGQDIESSFNLIKNLLERA